ncbi:MAG: hypothetical protein VW443_03030 [Pseudomonadales bacterium]
MQQYDISNIRKQMLDSGDAHLVHLCRELNDEKLRMVLEAVRDVHSKNIEAVFAKSEGYGA